MKFRAPKYHNAKWDAAREWVLERYPNFEITDTAPKALLYYFMAIYREHKESPNVPIKSSSTSR